jgi:hypothetical protein
MIKDHMENLTAKASKARVAPRTTFACVFPKDHHFPHVSITIMEVGLV